MAAIEATIERLKDKAERLLLADELEYNVPYFTPLRKGLEVQLPASVTPDALSELEELRAHVTQFTVRTYRPHQSVGNEPLLLDQTFEEALLSAYFALEVFSVSNIESVPSHLRPVFDDLRLRADATVKSEGYSFGREFYKLLSRNREGIVLNVLFQEYINRDHAERSGRIAFYRDAGGVYSYKSSEVGAGPIVRDVDYSRRGVVSGTFSRADQIADEVIRNSVARPLQTLGELFPWKQGVVIEFDYHRIPVGRRRERLILYDFHEADVTVQDVTGSAVSNIDRTSRLTVVSRTKGPIDPKEVAERILAGLAGRKGVYISGPITTGLEFYRLLKHLGVADMTDLSTTDRSRLKQELDTLVQGNITRMNEFADEVRLREPSPIVNPGEIAISDWSQEHYMSLWSRVIQLGVSRLYFLDGWEYSNGALAEYRLGKELGLELLDERAQELSVNEAKQLLRSAIKKLLEMGFEAPSLGEAIHRLDQTSSFSKSEG